MAAPDRKSDSWGQRELPHAGRIAFRQFEECVKTPGEESSADGTLLQVMAS